MRKAFGAATLIHFLLFIFSLCLVGFWPMFYNMILCSWAYSCYLTLREREFIVYFIMVIAATVL